jgi:hypothetical protein
VIKFVVDRLGDAVSVFLIFSLFYYIILILYDLCKNYERL